MAMMIRMRCGLLRPLVLLLACLVPRAGFAGWCAERADLAGPCFAIRGRASLANGNPTVRIWKVGTKRVLGLSDGRCTRPECEPLPAELRAALDWDHAVLGDFVLCPFTRPRPGAMQLVCIEHATRLRRIAHE